jgi:cathepsin B
MACNGGWLNVAFNYLKNNGSVEEDCFKYVSASGSVPACPNKCDSGFEKEWTADKHFCKTISNLHSPEAIKKEIYENGPVEAGFRVYQDFMSYKSGVYRHQTGGLLGGHAIEIIGWGKNADGEFWVAKNSWGPSWGESGFFNIAFGECDIDADVYGCSV